MKLITILVAVILAAFGGAALFKRLSGGGELPIEGFDDGVALTHVPPIQESL